jgi:hypothetical protein
MDLATVDLTDVNFHFSQMFPICTCSKPSWKCNRPYKSARWPAWQQQQFRVGPCLDWHQLTLQIEWVVPLPVLDPNQWVVWEVDTRHGQWSCQWSITGMVRKDVKHIFSILKTTFSHWSAPGCLFFALMTVLAIAPPKDCNIAQWNSMLGQKSHH